ncbi:MAG: response regulator transcription factor [Lachnospiraceae bacterium]|nr:response regulator transcription factor [Lachnospiraceae bacterium]
MNMIRTAICDDDAKTRAYLASLILAQPCPCEIVEYASADDCLADRREIDLLFLDIELGISGSRLDGMALARQLRQRDSEIQPLIIFVTGYDQYVYDAFDVGAFQYLLKPVNEEKFARAFARAAARVLADRKHPRKVRTLTLRSAHTRKTIPLSSIRYIESCNHKVVLHLNDGVFAYYAKIRDLEAELQGQFFRIHKGYLVNLSCIDGYSKSEVTLTNGERLLLSKYKYPDFVRAYLRFLEKGAAND